MTKYDYMELFLHFEGWEGAKDALEWFQWVGSGSLYA